MRRSELGPHAKDRALARELAVKLLAYCRAGGWAGYDPYDALNSRLLQRLGLLRFKFVRLGLIQALKRSPINFRPLLGVPKTQNPKGLALFITSVLKLSRLGLATENLAGELAAKLVALRSPGSAYWCWGYSFPWQTRTLLVPRWAPNLVCTTFAANALLDLYEACGAEKYLKMAASAADYVRNELLWTDGESIAGFSYPAPGLRSQIHNTNFLGAALLCRVYAHNGDRALREVALKVARHSARRQYEDGSWDYGEQPAQRWKDNFHTGFNLCALRDISRYAGTSEFESHTIRGLEFYREHYFREDGAPRYFHDRTYPLDAHSVAQSIITLLMFRDLDERNLEVAGAVCRWAKANLWSDSGCFYYRKLPYGTVRISYMRWTQAWMLCALAAFLETFYVEEKGRAVKAGEIVWAKP